MRHTNSTLEPARSRIITPEMQRTMTARQNAAAADLRERIGDKGKVVAGYAHPEVGEMVLDVIHIKLSVAQAEVLADWLP